MTHDKLMRVVDWPFFQTIKQALLNYVDPPNSNVTNGHFDCDEFILDDIYTWVVVLLRWFVYRLTDFIHQQTSNHPASES